MSDIVNGPYAYVRKYRWQLLRFLFVGAATFLLNICFIWVFYEKVGFDNRISVTGAYIVTVAIHFGLNHSFTYRQSVDTVGVDFVRYVVMVVFNYFITLFVSILVVELLGLSIYLGGIFSVLITGFSSFILMNHFVFSGKMGGK